MEVPQSTLRMSCSRLCYRDNRPLPSVRHRVQDSEVSRPEPPEADGGVRPAEEEVRQRDQRPQALHLPPSDHR